MKLYRILFLVAFISVFSCSGPSQQETEQMLSKTWIAYEYEKSDGEKLDPPADTQNDYLKFESDGTFESLEYGIITVRGTWMLDSTGVILTMKQETSGQFADEIVTRIIKIDKDELVLEGTDASGKKTVVYSRPASK